MNPVHHFALGQWDAIGRMMYLSNFCASEGLRHLSHKPIEAVPFATSEEAEAARAAFEPMIRWESYLESSTPAARSLFVCEVTAATLHCVYPDGSGLATEYIRQTMQTIAQYEQHCALLRAFIQKHLDRLNGIPWRGSCWYDTPKISIGSPPFAMNGEYVGPEKIAQLWPDAAWKRKRAEYPPEGFIIYDWIAKVDGVELTIHGAQSIRIRPVDTGKDGTPVKFGSEVAA